MAESLLGVWKEREPFFEERFRDDLMTKFCSIGKTSNKSAESEAKVFGPAYDLIIVAFFIGLYSDETTPLDKERKINHLGRILNTWGVKTGENFIGEITRKDYSILTTYIFIALVAKCDDIDFIKLDKGEIDVNEVVRKLIQKMEEYTNYGFQYLQDLYKKDPYELLATDGFYGILNDKSNKFIKSRESFTEE